MHYTTKIILLAGENRVHYMVVDSTLCGIKKLSEKQTILKYYLDEEKLCDECAKISRVPRIKDWCPRYKIENGDHAKSALSILYLFYQALEEEVQIGWGIFNFFSGNSGNSKLMNVLINPDPKIEEVIEEEKALMVDIVGGDGRVKSKISFDLIAEYMPLIKEDFLKEILQKKYTN